MSPAGPAPMMTHRWLWAELAEDSFELTFSVNNCQFPHTAKGKHGSILVNESVPETVYAILFIELAPWRYLCFVRGVLRFALHIKILAE